MNTNREILSACIASMLLIGSVSAQTIYKQVDEEGRVVFTDQPSAGSRTLGTIDTSRPRAQQPAAENTDNVSRAEPLRRADPIAEPSRRMGTEDSVRPSEPERRIFVEQRDTSRRIVSETAINPGMSSTSTPRVEAAKRTAEVPGIGSPQAGAQGTRSGYGEVERAIATYTALNTPMAAQADAVEAARRARQGATKDTVGAVLVVQATPREHEQVIKTSGMDSMYYIWAGTFFALAAGLLYVGWQVFRLILGTAFPRWHVGAA